MSHEAKHAHEEPKHAAHTAHEPAKDKDAVETKDVKPEKPKDLHHAGAKVTVNGKAGKVKKVAGHDPDWATAGAGQASYLVEFDDGTTGTFLESQVAKVDKA